MKEVEILFDVKSSKSFALRALEGLTPGGVKKILDVYFFDPLRSNLKPNEQGKLFSSFRLRKSDEKYYFTYKVDHYDGDVWSHSDEYETVVGDFEIGLHILTSLGLQELVRVDNEKHVYMTDEYEIVLEIVDGLGLFIEIEKLSQVSDEDVLETKDKMRIFLKNLGIELGDEQNAGKPELILKKKTTF